MCRICENLEQYRKSTAKKLLVLELLEKSLFKSQQETLDTLVEVLSYIYPRRERIHNNLSIITKRRSQLLPTELIVIIKDYLKEDLKDLNREYLTGIAFITKKKRALEQIDSFFPSNPCEIHYP